MQAVNFPKREHGHQCRALLHGKPHKPFVAAVGHKLRVAMAPGVHQLRLPPGHHEDAALFLYNERKRAWFEGAIRLSDLERGNKRGAVDLPEARRERQVADGWREENHAGNERGRVDARHEPLPGGRQWQVASPTGKQAMLGDRHRTWSATMQARGHQCC